MSSANKYTEVLAKYAKLCKDTLKTLKSSQKATLKADPAFYAEYNNLVLKFNKYRNQQPVGKDATKALARKMKSLAQRAEGLTQSLKVVGTQITSGLKEKAANHKKKGGIKSSKDDGQEEKQTRHVHFRAEVQMLEISNEESSTTAVAAKRTWNDGKKRDKPLDRGQFQDREVQIIMNALCQHVV